ncbi:MAG: type II toxin-antitoxin system PemK/MazF family toxin [Bacteroidota bacterium]|nr:type II toxin-antitoxin system PemK/MazF family toxin [Bacteroidota bacterium]MDP4234287.1 type II toxin-antitoxin system PemK/MazF family toxin [Bacteroidota bacterium]MDP4243222.1 type II toxin-antitoxin system PemK/MazF family toxin [Bacteroidota bacterium]MDP4288072.1 type II toxin-antitoxin system PemK/MazF family toxin [Bacteroidota bacterium]
MTDSKVRPAVIVTPNKYLASADDVLCAFISSSLPDPVLPSDIILSSADSDFQKTGLKRTSVLRAHKLVLLNRALVYSKLGDLAARIELKLNKALLEALGLTH